MNNYLAKGKNKNIILDSRAEKVILHMIGKAHNLLIFYPKLFTWFLISTYHLCYPKYSMFILSIFAVLIGVRFVISA